MDIISIFSHFISFALLGNFVIIEHIEEMNLPGAMVRQQSTKSLPVSRIEGSE
jgi:hypothetical protein